MASASSAVAGPSTGAAPTSRHPKLDGVIYHFYSKTSAVITSCRLTHFEPAELMTGSSSTSSRRQQQVRRMSTDSPSSVSVSVTSSVRPSTTGSTGRRPSKWFALEIDDQDVFREEIRLWRNISSLIPEWLLDSAPSTVPLQGPVYVPPMILDVILDTSALSSKHVLMIDEPEADGRTRKRVRVDGRDTDPLSRRSSLSGRVRQDRQTQEDEPLDAHRQSIMLETWRLDFAIHNPHDPPDLPTLYKHATAHFREVFAYVTDLPAYALHQRLKMAWESSLERRKDRASSPPDEDATEEEESANLLKVGVRLAIGHPLESEEGHLGLREPVGSMHHATDTDPAGAVTRTHAFPTILTPIGSMTFSVEYRRNVDFYVEDWHVIKSLQEIALDEDYFRPTMAKHLQRRASTAHQSPLSSSPSSLPGPVGEKPRSLLTATSHQQQQQPLNYTSEPAAGMATINAQGSATDAMPSRSAPNTTSATSTTTVFGSLGAASGRPVAGLSSLRASPSVAGFSAGPSPATLGAINPGSGTSSPALSAAMASDAAFLTHSRRQSSSTSERRLRTLSMLGSGAGEKESPPSPVMTTSPLASRPILSRAAVSVFPRSGSYSPSSPSPLAQQLYAQQNAAVMAANSQSGKLSSSPSFRGAFANSISPSLRSVFQTYTPSQSQTSISSLSRTPPKSLLEGPQATAHATSSGTRGTEPGSSLAQACSSPSSASRQPTVAPQMIKRYSSTFNYRQGRQGSSAGSDGSSGGAFSKSWQARIEQRQLYTARSLGREESLQLSTSSPLSRRRPSLAGSAGQEDELDDLVRMIDSRPFFGATQPEARDEGASRSDASAQRRQHASTESSHPTGSPTKDDAEEHGRTTTHTSSLAPIRIGPMQISSVIGFPRNHGLNRHQVDEMLSKMQHSVRDFSSSVVTSRSSPASGGAATSSSGGQSNPEHSPSQHGVAPSSNPTRSPLSRGGYSAISGVTSARSASGGAYQIPIEAIASRDGLDGASPSNGSLRQGLPSHREPISRSKSAISRPSGYSGQDVGRDDDRHTGRTAPSRDEADEDEDEEQAGTRDSREESRMSRSHPGRTTSRGSLELYGGTPHSYDPLDDEAAGRLELAGDETVSVGGGMDAGDVLHGPHHRHGIHGAPTPDLIGGQEARQRQADYELARNFTQTVSIRGGNGRTTAGRASLSPWRQRGFHPPNTSGAISAATTGQADNNVGVPHHVHSHLSRHTTGHSHSAPGSRSGTTSAGPTSRTGSPSVD